MSRKWVLPNYWLTCFLSVSREQLESDLSVWQRDANPAEKMKKNPHAWNYCCNSVRKCPPVFVSPFFTGRLHTAVSCSSCIPSDFCILCEAACQLVIMFFLVHVLVLTWRCQRCGDDLLKWHEGPHLNEYMHFDFRLTVVIFHKNAFLNVETVCLRLWCPFPPSEPSSSFDYGDTSGFDDGLRRRNIPPFDVPRLRTSDEEDEEEEVEFRLAEKK